MEKKPIRVNPVRRETVDYERLIKALIEVVRVRQAKLAESVGVGND